MANGTYSGADTTFQPCNCVGPQDGQPACPCAMRNVQILNGRYVIVQDLGPVPQTKSTDVVYPEPFRRG